MRLLTLACLLAFSACLGSPEDDPTAPARAEEMIGTAPEPIVSSTAESSTGLPEWHVCLDEAGVQSSAPPVDFWKNKLVGKLNALHAIRAGDEKTPGRWVWFSLKQHWSEGDRMFDWLILQGSRSPENCKQHGQEDNGLCGTGFGPVDMLMITSELLSHKDNLPVCPSRKHSRIYESPEPYNPFPWPGLPGDDHTGPGPGSSKPSPPKSDPSGQPRQPNKPKPGWTGQPDRRTPAQKQHDQEVAAAQAAAQEKRDRELFNGVNPDSPAAKHPQAFPGTGQPGEKPELFRCEGTVYQGYKSACIDFQPMPDGEKWAHKLTGWNERHREEVIGALSRRPSNKEICEVAQLGVAGLSCGAATVACAGATVLTVGTASVPCWLVYLGLCVYGGFQQAILAAHCGEK